MICAEAWQHGLIARLWGRQGSLAKAHITIPRHLTSLSVALPTTLPKLKALPDQLFLLYHAALI